MKFSLKVNDKMNCLGRGCLWGRPCGRLNSSGFPRECGGRYYPVMKLDVRKTARQYEITVLRDDGVSLALRPPDRKFSPPHDVVHFVVEQTLGLDEGFWGTVAKGAKFPSMTVIEGRQAPHAEARSKSLIKQNHRSLNEAEVYVGVFQDALLRKPRDHGKVIQRRLEERGRELEPDEIEHVWSSLVTLQKRWVNLPVGGSVVLDWRI